MQNSNDKILDYIIKELNNYKLVYWINFRERRDKIRAGLKILQKEKYKIPSTIQEDLIKFAPSFISDLYEPSNDCIKLYFKIFNSSEHLIGEIEPSKLIKKIIPSDVEFIKYIKNPSEEGQKKAIDIDIFAIQYIKKPTQTIQKYAINKDILGLCFIKNPSKEIQMYAIDKNWKAIYYIKNPSEKIQMYAIKKNWRAIDYITYPSPIVKRLSEEEFEKQELNNFGI